MASNANGQQIDFKNVDLRQLLAFSLLHWRIALAAAIGFGFIGLLLQVLLTPYQLKTQLVVNDAQTSQLQAFSSNFFGLSKKQGSTRKNQTGTARAVEFLQRPETFLQFARTLVLKANSGAFEADSAAYLSSFESKMGEDWKSNPDRLKSISIYTQSVVGLSAQSPTDLQITVSSLNRNLTYFISVEYAQFALDALKQLERKEIEQVRSALEKQRDHFKDQFLKLNRELIAFQTRPDHVLSLASGDNIANYLSDLMIRKNEVELKISENQRTIEFLGGHKAAVLAANRNLGQRSHIQQLMEATNLLKKQASAIQESINKFTRSTSGSAEVIRIAEELKKTSDREFKNFQESNDLLSKLGVIETAIEGKFELVRSPFIEEVQKKASIWFALALSIFLSQLVFAGFVFFQFVRLMQMIAARPKQSPSPLPPENVLTIIRSPTQEL